MKPEQTTPRHDINTVGESAAGAAETMNITMSKRTSQKPNERPGALNMPMAVPIGGWPNWMVRVSLLVLWALIAVLSFAPGVLGEEAPADTAANVLDMSLEDLLNVEITSVSKRSEKRTAAAAAIYVLTQEDIRRSGATTVPDLLRTVPGIHVAQIDSNRWSVTARSFSGRFSTMLLVLIDGRTIYTPFFSGVYWEANDVMLEDVDRIEVIRGPGGTLWGANAVNGVINIVTKSAADTQGGLVSVLGGKEERASGALRYGGKIGDIGHYRVYGKYFLHDEGGDFVAAPSQGITGNANDDWQNGHAGFRMDFDLNPEEKLTVQGGFQALDANNTYQLPYFEAPFYRQSNENSRFQNFHMLGRWSKRLANDSEIQLQGFYDYYHLDEATLDEQRHTLDVDFQHRLQVGARHDILWGIGYRITVDEFDNTAFASMNPSGLTNHMFSGFIQDEITILDTLKLTIGTKIEHNDYTGIEVQPNARIAWTPNERHTLWASVSRAVRTPSRSESDIRLEFGEQSSAGFPGVFLAAFGNDDLESTELLAYELGYRVSVTERVALDFALFHNNYDNVRNFVIGDVFSETEPQPTHDLAPLLITSTGDARTWGLELGADVSVRPWWLIRATYTYIDFETNDVPTATGAQEVPNHLFSIQNRLDLPRNVEFDTTLRYAGDIDSAGIGDYLELDARLAWRPRENLELALVGRNLFNNQHEEYNDEITLSVPTQVQRTIYGKITWRF